MKSLSLILFTILSFQSYGFFDTMSCMFTEPFISYEISNGGKKVVYNDPVVEKKIDISSQTLLVGPYLNERNVLTYKLLGTDPRGGKLELVISLNMNGDDGMSETVYPFQAAIQNFWGPQDLFGGCLTNNMKSFFQDGSFVDTPNEYKEKFFQNAKIDITNCFQRALHPWTKKKSAYSKRSIFNTLYSWDQQIYKANILIDNLSSAESDGLTNLVRKTKKVPFGKIEKREFEKNALNVCEYYSRSLISRLKAM
ncbi:hypothetical protein N9O57_00820 [bacterium]|nr:hypothetical protein [bacterium]